MRHLFPDLRYAFRGLARSPLFTSVALLSIALGIGANTAIFTLVDEVLLRQLPVKDPGQLVLFNGARNHYGNNSGGNMLSFPMYEDFRDDFVERGTAPALPRVSLKVANGAPAPKIFSGMFARRAVAMNVGVDGQTERVPGELVSGTYFPRYSACAPRSAGSSPRTTTSGATARSPCSATTTGGPVSAQTRKSSGRS
jgi:hypothetical protein